MLTLVTWFGPIGAFADCSVMLRSWANEPRMLPTT